MNTERVPGLSTTHRTTWLRRISSTLLALGSLLLVAGGLYTAQQILSRWLAEQDRQLAVHAGAPLSIPDVALPAPSVLTAFPAMPATKNLDVAAPETTPVPESYPAVRLRIPALNLTRSIINLPRTQDSRTGAWTRDVDILFRPGRRDLVGHWEGSAHPGQEGNMILVGHNYGRGFNGAFQLLGRLKAGQKVYVTDESGQIYTYHVTTVKRLRWKNGGSEELAAHWQYLSPDGPERLTLVTCAGAQFEPFPQRVYVVAEPAP